MAAAGNDADGPAVMSFRRDLRIHDFPALAEAAGRNIGPALPSETRPKE